MAVTKWSFLFALASFGCSATEQRREDVVIQSGDVRLTGTIVAPSTPGRYPALVLIHGSGPDGRDNLYYWNVANAFVDGGFAVLVYDKRGSGDSGGDWRHSHFNALIDDAVAASKLLKAHPWVDSGRVGVWGGSEGGAIAPEIALRSNLAFVIMQSAPGVTFGRQNVVQTERQIAALTSDSAEQRAAMRLQQLKHAVVRDSARWSDYETAARDAAQRSYAGFVGPPRGDWWWRWYKSKVDYTPIPSLERLPAPVLAIWGSEDILVPVGESRSAISRARARLDISGDSLIVIRGADHSLLINGFMGVLRRGLRNQPVHIDIMVEWARHVL